MTRDTSVALFVAALLLTACGSAPSSAANTPSPNANVSDGSPSPTNSTASPGSAATRFTFVPEPGSTVTGTVEIATTSNGVTVAATVHGLKADGNYIVDADPLACQFFALGPSQSFAKPIAPDVGGSATVTWVVPTGMAGNANVQGLTTQGTYAVLACIDLAT